ncbi:MAG: FecR family protein [Draconibacterium sp.]
MKEPKNYNADKAWERVNKKATQKQRVRLITRVSLTSVALIAAVAIMFPFFNTELNEELTAQEQMVIRKKATLYMAEGTTVELSDSLDYSLEQIIVQKNITPLNTPNVKKVRKNILDVPTGGEYYFELPDGTRVWLNSQTRLEFPTEFTGNTREIALSGQAYFDVVHNPEKPFIVHTDLGKVEVKGTSFDLKVYKNDRTFETTLVEGSVSLEIPNQPNTIIKPGQRSVYSDTSHKLSTKNVDVQLYTSWKNGIFYFENRNLTEIAKELERWYEVSFKFADNNAQNIRYTGEYNKNQKLSDILELLSKTGGVSFAIKDSTIQVSSNPM